MGGQVGQIDLSEFARILMESQDDEYFHLTCHIDINLKEKIERVEFVELDKLLPRTRRQIMNEDQKMQFVNRNGATFDMITDAMNAGLGRTML